MNFWKIFQLVLQMAPMIIGLVRQVESAMPGPGLGAKKLELVQNIVQTAAAAEPELNTAITTKDLNGIVTNIVNFAVSTFNAVGAFVKATP